MNSVMLNGQEVTAPLNVADGERFKAPVKTFSKCLDCEIDVEFDYKFNGTTNVWELFKYPKDIVVGLSGDLIVGNVIDGESTFDAVVIDGEVYMANDTQIGLEHHHRDEDLWSKLENISAIVRLDAQSITALKERITWL